jgi:predicted amidophosphoribosyltransferase
VDKIRLKQGAGCVLQSLNHLLLPAVCVNCRENICETDKNLCRSCWQQILSCSSGDYCPRCGKDAGKFALVEGACPDCQGGKINFDGIARGGVYTEALKEMILAFKSAGRTELNSILGFLGNTALQGSAFYNDIEFFVPVPLHWSTRLQRGYNQSLIIAKELKHTSAKINTDLV